MNLIIKIYSFIDNIFEKLTLLSLILLVIIVTLQVVTRYFFNFVFFWSEEITLLLLVWFGFMGIAIGFREYIHLGIDTFTNLFPKMFNKVLDKVIRASVFATGIYLVVQGSQFTILMLDSTLPATKLPSSITYIIMPITGFMICLYTLLQFFNVDTSKYKDIEEAI
ncbi:TRAP transporter small permease [Psychrobacillus sp. BM2]|uniref:TRAP transporter small permease n=1 Tax=Psychrobacillus sp. BM2 TaxID=3400421 RepID=UPI003B0223E7